MFYINYQKYSSRTMKRILIKKVNNMRDDINPDDFYTSEKKSENVNISRSTIAKDETKMLKRKKVGDKIIQNKNYKSSYILA
jgi:hypothetical protein